MKSVDGDAPNVLSQFVHLMLSNVCHSLLKVLQHMFAADVLIIFLAFSLVGFWLSGEGLNSCKDRRARREELGGRSSEGS